jgi:hypothetical protein
MISSLPVNRGGERQSCRCGSPLVNFIPKQSRTHAAARLFNLGHFAERRAPKLLKKIGLLAVVSDMALK